MDTTGKKVTDLLCRHAHGGVGLLSAQRPKAAFSCRTFEGKETFVLDELWIHPSKSCCNHRPVRVLASTSHFVPDRLSPSGVYVTRGQAISLSTLAWIRAIQVQRIVRANRDFKDQTQPFMQVQCLTSAGAMVSTSARALCACRKIPRSQAGRTLCRWPRCRLKQPLAVVTRTSRRLLFFKFETVPRQAR